MLPLSLPRMVSLACLLLCPPVVFSQGETTSAIVGQVSDPTHATIPGALVSVFSRQTGFQRGVTTDQQGRFDFPQLKPGTYVVKVVADGFDTQQQDNVVSGLGQTQTINFTPRPARPSVRRAPASTALRA